MQSVSEEYVSSMRSIGRNRGYIKVTLGIVNSKAQETLEVAEDANVTYYSDESVLQGNPVTQPYATCEQNFSKVDGTMYFLPPSTFTNIYNNGIVSEELYGSIIFDFDCEDIFDVAGFTIDFGDNYPIDFTISNGTDTLTFEDNDTRYFSTELGLHNIERLIITATNMVCGDSRLRIYSLQMGVSNVFDNDNTMSFRQSTYVSSIADTLPSTDMTIVVTNYDQYYNPDNADSILSFFEVGQEVKVQFGYDSNDDGEIEWLPETITHLKTWEATDRDATFTATDIFDYLNGIYYGGKVYPNGISLYDLAEDVLNDGNIEDYKLDSYLKKVVVNNPLPPVAHTEALQIIANAGRCTLREDRDGKIYIESAFIPDYDISSNGETEYSNVANLKNDEERIFYAICSNDFSILNNSVRFMADTPDLESAGYISKLVSNQNGVFYGGGISYDGIAGLINLNATYNGNGGIVFKSSPPIISIDLEADYSPNGLGIDFKNVTPQEFKIKTYLNDELSEEILVENPDINYSLHHMFDDFTKMELVFTKAHPNSRITIENFEFGAPTDYTIQRDMMMDSPKATRQDKIKDITVATHKYSESNKSSTNTIKITDAENGEYNIDLSDASYGYSIKVKSGSAKVSIVTSSAYRVVFKLENVKSKTVEVSLTSKAYLVSDGSYMVSHNANGLQKTWDNPLISTDDHAAEIEEWLAEYFLGDVEYEFNWRGDPRTDANDLFFLELKTGETVNIRGYQNDIEFTGKWSGSMKARKVVL